MCSNLFTSLQFPQRFAYLAFVGCSLTLERLRSLQAMAEPAPPARRRTGRSAVPAVGLAQAKDEKPDDDALSEISTMCGDDASMPEFLCDRCDETETLLNTVAVNLNHPFRKRRCKCCDAGGRALQRMFKQGKACKTTWNSKSPEEKVQPYDILPSVVLIIPKQNVFFNTSNASQKQPWSSG